MIDSKTLKNLKLIVFDLDGTLLNKYGEIGVQTIEYVAKLKELGVRFTFATGRVHNSIIEYADTLNITTPIVSLDGAIIKTHPEGKFLYESYVKKKYVVRAMEMANKGLLKIGLSHDEAIFYTPANALVPQLMDKYDANFQEVESYEPYLDSTLEVIICGDYKNVIKEIEAKTKFPSAIGLKTSFYKSHDQDGVYFLEIRNKNCSKGDGVLKLLKQLKINEKQTAVMGDWYNDRSMFRTKAVKVAVGNAISELKEMADHVTQRTNNEDAVAEFLEMVYKAKQG